MKDDAKEGDYKSGGWAALANAPLFIQENPVQILAQTEIFFFLFCLCLI
jgi:hypothetical protein